MAYSEGSSFQTPWRLRPQLNARAEAKLSPSENLWRASGRWSSRSENRETETPGLWNDAVRMRITSLVPDVGCRG